MYRINPDYQNIQINLNSDDDAVHSSELQSDSDLFFNSIEQLLFLLIIMTRNGLTKLLHLTYTLHTLSSPTNTGGKHNTAKRSNGIANSEHCWQRVLDSTVNECDGAAQVCSRQENK